MRKRIRPLLMLMAVIFTAAGCPAQVKGPGIRFASERYDFGTIDEGKIFTHTFEYTNTGTEPLVIGAVLATCSCTHIESYDREVQPGMTGKLTVVFNSMRLDGKVTKNILLGTNVPDRESISLTMEGVVRPSPAAVSTISVGDGSPAAVLGRLQTGETLIGESASPSRQVKVVFAKPFSGAPKIIATVRNDPLWEGGDTFAVTIRRASGTEFVANIVRVDKAQPWHQKPLLVWMAWE